MGMALGTNRDYKTTDRRVRRNLSLTARLAADYEKTDGLSHDVAVEKAANLVLYPIPTSNRLQRKLLPLV